jgi:hypothetical protein
MTRLDIGTWFSRLGDTLAVQRWEEAGAPGGEDGLRQLFAEVHRAFQTSTHRVAELEAARGVPDGVWL